MRKSAKKQQSEVQTIQRTVPSRNATQDNDSINTFWKSSRWFCLQYLRTFCYFLLLLGLKIRTATEQQLSAWMRKVMETRAEFHFSWIYTFSGMLLAELSKPRQIPVANQHSRATVLIIQQTATSSKSKTLSNSL